MAEEHPQSAEPRVFSILGDNNAGEWSYDESNALLTVNSFIAGPGVATFYVGGRSRGFRID